MIKRLKHVDYWKMLHFVNIDEKLFVTFFLVSLRHFRPLYSPGQVVLIWVCRRVFMKPLKGTYLLCVDTDVHVSGKRYHCFYHILEWVWDLECWCKLVRPKELYCQILGQRFLNISEHQSHSGRLLKSRCHALLKVMPKLGLCPKAKLNFRDRVLGEVEWSQVGLRKHHYKQS